MFDTSVCLGFLSNDPSKVSTTALLDEIRTGRTLVEIDPLVVHELTYGYPRHHPGSTRVQIYEALEELLAWPGVIGPKEIIRLALERWQSDLGLSFVDAFLVIRAELERLPVYTLNRRDFLRQGVDAPDLRDLMGTG